ncbi:tigger transposable element-derived protein 1-like [Condylostylus longicornis]|uniref:tigger transposable element-derived protein 1-like n=1 Tax=Condylostylus longicornis TaxID=2530218 RepID=UPI00244E0A1B|nr:tigger transposable element-derived protein 1-like [Condylostylus longicornis]
MEHALIIWIEDCLDKKIPLSTNIIKQKALRVYTHLRKDELSSKEEPNLSFLASKGWFENFKKRFSLRNVKLQGEQASADVEAAQKFILEIPRIIEEGEYSADQIFNADESALYWKRLPSRTFISKNEKQSPGYKTCKDRVTLHMCSNLSGNFVVKPMIINRSLNPRALKNVDKSHLPVFWRANKKGWMTQNLFEDCYQVVATTSDNLCHDGEITSEEEFQPTWRKKRRLAVISDESDDEN